MKIPKNGKRSRWLKSSVTLFIFTPVAFLLMNLVGLNSQPPNQVGQNLSISSTKRQPKIFFLATADDLNCAHKFNHICRFWFYIRCILLGGFANVIIVSPQYRVVNDIIHFVEEDDIVLTHWRIQNHTLIPDFLRSSIDFQKQNPLHKKFRVGIFHSANERNRTDWPWYIHADFVIRNYWVHNRMPAHVQYVPLGPQYPHVCFPDEIRVTHLKHPTPFQHVTPGCSCGKLSFKPASHRHYLWSFTGSLRRNRAKLVGILNQRTELDNGIVRLARKFGGDGIVGSKDPSKNPKTEHLKIIANSKFVFCPCGNVMETHRIYEAIILGAIPVIENCEPELSNFFPIPELLLSTPEEMVQFTVKFKNRSNDVMELQARLKSWWLAYVEEIRTNVSKTILGRTPSLEKKSI